MSTLWTIGEGFTEVGLSPVSIQRSSAGVVWTGAWVEGVTLTLLVLGTGLRVTAELGGGMRRWEEAGGLEGCWKVCTVCVH